MAKAYLGITLKIDKADRGNAAGVYNQYKTPFLESIQGAMSKELLIRDEDVQVLHGSNAVSPAVEVTPIYKSFIEKDKIEETLQGFNDFHPIGRVSNNCFTITISKIKKTKIYFTIQ
jgi:hypothetical protein